MHRQWPCPIALAQVGIAGLKLNAANNVAAVGGAAVQPDLSSS
jgi:hypothetical protein